MNSILQTVLFYVAGFPFTIDSVLTIIAVLILARSMVYLVGLVLENYFERNDLELTSIENILRFLRYTLYIISVFLAFNIIGFDYNSVLDTRLFPIKENYYLTIGKVLTIVLILVVARLISYVFNPIITGYLKRKKVDPGRQYAIIQFLRYLLYLVAFLVGFYLIDLKLTMVWGGLVGLLVGIGLGLQQTFNDWFSGLLILLEASVEVGDVLQLETDIVQVKSIGIRSSKVETRDGVVVIVPNSKLVVNSVVNWSNNHRPTRFEIRVGVSYSSDIKLVTEVLLSTAKSHISILKEPPPLVMFKDFGSSSLDFVLYFYSNDFFYIEKVKSDLRYNIVDKFRENDIEIPFPQRDVWMRSSPVEE